MMEQVALLAAVAAGQSLDGEGRKGGAPEVKAMAPETQSVK